MPDGIERAEPTIAPSRHRLTAELAKSRFRHIQTDLKAGPTVATADGTAFTSSLEGCQVISHILSKPAPTNLIHSTALFLHLAQVELIHRELFNSSRTVAESVSR